MGSPGPAPDTPSRHRSTMIERILLQNYQGWESLDLVLDPHVTVLVGPSDRGKSAVLRAFNWVATNKPPGTEDIRRGCSGGRVRVYLDGGRHITRQRRKDENLYLLDGTALKAFGQGVPADVTALLNISDINYQTQQPAGVEWRASDPAYWFSATPGNVSRAMNAIVNLEEVDTTLANVGKVARRSKVEADLCLERVRAAKQQRDGLDWVLDADRALRGVEQHDEALGVVQARADKLAAMVRNVARAEDHATSTRDRAEAAERLLGLAATAGKAGAATGRLRALCEKITAAQAAAAVVVPDTARLDAAWDRLQGTHKRRAGLARLCGAIKSQEELLWERNKQAAAADKELKKAQSGRCPLCNRMGHPSQS